MALAMKHFLAACPLETLRPGDVLITNDPWLTSGHLNDVTICSPIFRGEECIAFFASTCHTADIGGHVLSAEAREVYEEGLQIPIMKLYEAGRPNEALIAIIRANTRLPRWCWATSTRRSRGAPSGATGSWSSWRNSGSSGSSRWPTRSPGARSAPCARRSARSDRRLHERDHLGRVRRADHDPRALRDSRRRAARGLRRLLAASRRGVNVVMNYTEAYTTYGVK